MIERAAKERMHPRNRFRDGYDFKKLAQESPSLAPFVGPNAYGDLSIRYADPLAVKALNQALLLHAYGLPAWDISHGYLCPPVPGRSDYLHYLADLLGGGQDGEIPRGSAVAVLDIGTGASCIYPLIGASEYGWRFVGSEVDPVAYDCAKNLAARAGAVANLIEIRRQANRTECFRGIAEPGELFDASMCNPPFHGSAGEASTARERKQRNLGGTRDVQNVSNFGGRAGELWCSGGELGFILRMIAQSAEVPSCCRWFTTLVSKGASLPRLYEALQDADVASIRTIPVASGQKESRILAWTFMPGGVRSA